MIERKSLNQHNLFVLTPTRMGFDPTLIETSHSPDDIGLLPLGAESDIGTDSHTDVCCHHSDAVGSCSPCTQCRLITDTADNGDEGHSSTHRIPTVGEEWGQSALWTGSGLNHPPSETGTHLGTLLSQSLHLSHVQFSVFIVRLYFTIFLFCFFFLRLSSICFVTHCN